MLPGEVPVRTSTKNMRVLVVDDEPSVCRSVEKILIRRGHVVDKTHSAAEAIQKLEANASFDIILADLMMPVVSGFDLLRIAHERWPAIPIVIMTGYASINSAIDATRAGAIGYLPKPFTPDELEAAIERTFLVMTPRAQAASPARVAPKATPAQGTVVARSPGDIIDVDMPFSPTEVAAATSADYVQHLTRSDMAVVDFCDLGQRPCKRFKTKGVCKQQECPLVVADRRKKAPVAVSAAIGDQIDVDMPFSFAEVSAATSEAYADALGRGDLAATWRWNPAKATGRRVLVVDDEPVVVSSMRRSLHRRGFRVDEAFSANEAINRIVNQMYDLVLLDMRMPDSSGLELLPTIKRHRPSLPVIIVTGYASIETAVEAIQRGATDYMAKPFTPDELCAAASRAIVAARPA
jgi:CheY-like chemotaxis protein